jgi:hypothetical protein
MKITKEKLTKVIAEEIEKTLNELNFNQQTGEPLNKEGERICAGNPKCFKAHILPLFKDGKKFSTKTGQPLDVLKKAASAFWKEKSAGPDKTDSARSLGDKPQRYREDPKTGRMVPVDKADKKPQSSAPQVDEKELQSLAVKAYKIAKEKDPSFVKDIVDIYKLSKQKKIKKEKAMDLFNKIITKLPLLEEDDDDLGEVTDPEEIVRNFMSTKAYTKAGMDDSQRAEFAKGLVKDEKFAQYIIDGEIFHVYGNQMFNSDDEEVDPHEPTKPIQAYS